jgi:hypothetical protein
MVLRAQYHRLLWHGGGDFTTRVFSTSYALRQFGILYGLLPHSSIFVYDDITNSASFVPTLSLIACHTF